MLICNYCRNSYSCIGAPFSLRIVSSVRSASSTFIICVCRPDGLSGAAFQLSFHFMILCVARVSRRSVWHCCSFVSSKKTLRSERLGVGTTILTCCAPAAC